MLDVIPGHRAGRAKHGDADVENLPGVPPGKLLKQVARQLEARGHERRVKLA